VPVPSRSGTIGNYKVYYANGDFAGVDLYSTFAPAFKNHLAFVIVEDQLAGGNRAAATARTSRGEDYAFILSPEITPFKGLDIKPLFSWFHADGATASAARRAAANPRSVGGTIQGAGAVGGGNAAGDSTNQEDRFTIGLDARWRMGPFGLDPTIAYQTGKYDSQAQRSNGQVARVDGDIAAWLFDVIGSFQLGPLLLEARGVYSTGNKARDNLALSKRYFEPLNLDTGYWGGWLGILGLDIDYFNGGGGANQGMDTNIGYDRYGRAQFALRATYSITPALSIRGVVAPTWAAEKVDTDTGACAPLSPGQANAGCPARTIVSDRSNVDGDSRYIGTEVNGGITWRFAPNAALDLAGYYLFAGDALDTTELRNGVLEKRDSNDGYYAALRVRLSF
jgi:hypothetical protein